MIENRGIVHLGGTLGQSPDDAVVVIEAFDEAERLRAHQLMTENYTLVGLERRRSADGTAYTEYRLLAPRPGQ